MSTRSRGLMSRLNPRGATPFQSSWIKKEKKPTSTRAINRVIWTPTAATFLPKRIGRRKRAGKTGSPLAHFNLPGLDGETVRSDAYTGSPLIISFWATWCELCKKELNDLRFSKKPRFKDESIAVATDAPETLPAVRQPTKKPGSLS